MLTLEGFLKRLRKTPRTWELVGSALRMDVAQPAARTWAACPITSMARGGAVGADQWRFVAEELGLPLALAKDIMRAADGFIDVDYKLRKQLLDACGKSETC